MASKSKTVVSNGSKSNSSNDLGKWKTQIQDGNVTEVLKHFTKSWTNIDPKDALTILNTLGRMLFKAQNDTNNEFNMDEVFDLFLRCAKILGLDSAAQENQFTIADVNPILFDLHCVSYIAFNKNYYSKLCQLTPMAVKLSKYVPNISKSKPEVLTRLEQITKFFWRSANKMTKTNKTLRIYFDVLELISILNTPQSYIEMCSLVDSLFGGYSYDSTEWNRENFQTILRNIPFKCEEQLTLEEKAAMESLLSNLMKHLFMAAIKSNVPHMAADIEAVQKLRGYFSKHTLDASTAVYNAMMTFISDKDSVTVKACRCFLQEFKSAKFTAKLVLAFGNHIVSSKSAWQTIKVSLVRDLQSLMLTALPLSPEDCHLSTAANIVRLASREFPESPQTNKWEDDSKIGVSYACSAVKAVNKLLKTINEQNFKDAIHLFRFVSYVASSLSLPAQMCYYDSQLLYEVLLDHMFQCIPQVLSNSDHLSQLLNLIGVITKNSNFVFCCAGGPAEQKRARKGVISALLGISAVVQCQEHIPEELYHSELKVALNNWCDMRQRSIVANLGNNNMSIVELWKKYEAILANNLNMEMIEPDWEILLRQEILGYSEHLDYVPLVLIAGNELENLPNKSIEILEWARTTLAIAFSKNQELGLDGPVTSQELCTTVITSLSEVKVKSAEQLVLLMEAYLQQYISYQKDQRRHGEKLAEIPLTTRAPPKRVGPGGESTAVEAWEEGEELSQLGSELSCRLESRSTYPLVNLLAVAMSLEKKNITQGNPSNAESALEVLECVGYICGVNGHHWMALKAWGLLFCLAQSMKNIKYQILALSMLISRFALTSGSQEERWLQQNIPLLKQELTNSPENLFFLRLHELCTAQCYFYSNKLEESADIVLTILSTVEPGAYTDNRELIFRAFLIASKLLVALPTQCKQRSELLDIVVGPVEAAEWAAMQVLRNVSMSKPAERKGKELRKLELMIDAGLWVSSLASLMGSYRTACISLQCLLQRVQRLMLPTRVAQILSCLGDLDLMTPDKEQLEQRLFWNQKILSLGSAIDGNKALKTPKQSRNVGTSPTRFNTKEYQLTSYCSEKCSKNTKNKGCSLCKNPLYHLCKAHYAFLVEGNEETCLHLYEQLRTTWEENCSRLWDLTWGNIIGESNKEETSVQGWLPMLVAPITILECRLKLSSCVVQAGKGDPRGALEIINELKATLSDLRHETAPILLNWTRAQQVACEMQIRGLGGFASKLQPMIPLSAIKTNADGGTLNVNISPRKVLTPRQPVPAVPPKKPGRRGAKATVDVSPIPLPVAPKLILPEDSVEISPTLKEMTLFTHDTKTTVRKKKGKENKDHSPYVNPKFVQPSGRVKKVTKEDTTKQSSSVAFCVFEDATTPSVRKTKPSSTLVSKSATKSVTSTSKMKPTPSRILDFSFSPSDSPAKLFTPRAPIHVYSSASKSMKKVNDATSTRKPITKSDSIITISSSDDSPIVLKSTARKTGRVVISSKVKKCVTSKFSSSSNDSPVLPPKSCSKTRPIIESSPESPIITKSSNDVKYVSSISKHRTKVTINSASSNNSNSPVFSKANKKLIEPSSEKHAQGVRAKQAVSSSTFHTKQEVSTKSNSKIIKETKDKATTSRNIKLNKEQKTSDSKVKDNVDNSISQSLVIDSDISVVENSIIEEKPKRKQLTKRVVR